MMEAPEFMTPEDGWEQLNLPAPFGDERKELDIFSRKMSDAAEYSIFIDGVEMGSMMYSDYWYPLSDCLLTAREISIITPIIEQTELRPPLPLPISDDEKRLREWLTSNSVHPNEPLMQAMIINSFFAEENDFDDEDLVPLGDIEFDHFDLSQEPDERDEDKENAGEWEEKVRYALDNLGNFLLYINAEWR